MKKRIKEIINEEDYCNEKYVNVALIMKFWHAVEWIQKSDNVRPSMDDERSTDSDALALFKEE